MTDRRFTTDDVRETFANNPAAFVLLLRHRLMEHDAFGIPGFVSESDIDAWWEWNASFTSAVLVETLETACEVLSSMQR